MKALKTTFPCVDCEKPAQVKRLADGPRARCSPCGERLRLVNSASWAWETAKKDYERFNGKIADVFELAWRMTEVVERATRAASNLFRAARLQPNLVISANWVRAARSWLRWSQGLSRSICGLMEHEGDRRTVLARIGLKVIDGGLEVPT